jgi:4a-hydroxytetrahydrobiopterin dehydratase
LSRPPRLDESVVGEWLAEHPTWHLDEGHLIRALHTVNYPSSVKIVDALVATAEALDHHPIITIGYRHLRFELWTHDQGGLTHLDLDYANAVDSLVSGDFASFVS